MHRRYSLALALVLISLAQANSVSAQVQEDVSMLLFRGAGGQMATSATALDLAKMVISHVYGEEDLKEQLPLQVKDGGDRWIVEGSLQPNQSTVENEHLVKSAVILEILKVNCQVVKLIHRAAIVPDGR